MKLMRATSSDEECSLLHAALADFSTDGPRERYAIWLEQRGERQRAAAVRGTIAAYQNLDVTALLPSEEAPDWRRMIAAPLLSLFIRGTANYERVQAQELRDRIFKRIKPALSLDYAPAASEPEIGASYLWGLPDLANGEAWPKTNALSDWFSARADIPQDLHCGFLGQIAFSDLRGSVLAEELPRAGGFAVFTIIEVDQLGIVETLVRPWDNTRPLKRATAPPDLLEDKLGQGINAPQTVHDIELREVLSLPDFRNGGPFAEAGFGYDGPHDRLNDLLIDGCVADALGGDSHLGFGGYLAGTSGADPSPESNSLRLAVLRSSPDAGQVHFAISAEDLTAGRVDRAQYVWNDWDS